MIRIEDEALLRGQGQFIDDENEDGQLVMAVLRSPVAHGLIRSLDVGRARGMPGVRKVLIAHDLEQHGVGPLGCRASVTGDNGQEMHEPERTVLAEQKLVYVGQPIAVVVAQTHWQALDALDAITLDVDDLPVVNDVTTAAEKPAIWPDVPGNCCFEWTHGNPKETSDLFDSADHVVELTVEHPRIAISPIETRGCLASFDRESGRYELITPSQGVVSIRASMADVLGVAPDKIRVITRDVGGSFAVKIWPYPEHVLALLAAKLTGCSVKWVCSRTESFGADAMGRARVDRARLALRQDGTFLAMQIDALADMGAFLNTAAPAIVTEGSVRTMGHSYRVPGLVYRVRAMLTNKTPVDAYRGAGKPETVGTIERLIDVAAQELGFDRFELREQNLITAAEIPYQSPIGVTYDAGDFVTVGSQIKAHSDWNGAEQRKRESEARGLLRGIGLGFYVHITGGSPNERSEVRALADGTILVRTGTQDSGQGHRTALAMVAAQTLDLPLEAIRVEQGDSDWLEKGGGTGGSNLMAIAGNTVYRTSQQMLEQARAIAAELMETAASDLEYKRGCFTIVGTDQFRTLAELAIGFEQMPASEQTPAMGAGCISQGDFEGVHATVPNGAYVFEIEVDPQTGVVRIDRITGVNDLGHVVNAQTTDGQLQGAIAQAVGEVLMEAVAYDEHGQITNGSLMDYALPRADDLPSMKLSLAGTGSPQSALGVKGVGEVASIGAPGALINAVHDALSGYSIRHIDMPLTPLKVWQAINDK
ncbi:MAG: xanthine dehydrogenase family protein molybdopterin-binding subunit [Burkholderiaceae bacterium]